jgi:hypothetical protein
MAHLRNCAERELSYMGEVFAVDFSKERNDHILSEEKSQN